MLMRLFKLFCSLVLCQLSCCWPATQGKQLPQKDFLLPSDTIQQHILQNADKQGAFSMDYQVALDILRRHSNRPVETDKTLLLPKALNYDSLEDILHQINPDSQQHSHTDQKRGFDSIHHMSDFGGLGKHSSLLNDLDNDNSRGFEEDNLDSPWDLRSSEGPGKRSFDSISGITGFGGLGKRSFDSISGISGFGGLGKRSFDSIAGFTGFGGLGKRSFDSISGVTGFGGLGKRSFDSISGVNPFRHLGKRAFDSINHFSGFGGLGKRSVKNKRGFDSIGHFSSFGGFGKRSNSDDQLMSDLVRLVDLLSSNNKLTRSKRSFDRIAHVTTFGGFGDDKRS